MSLPVTAPSEEMPVTSLGGKRWLIHPKAPADYLHRCQPHAPLIAQLLFSRGLKTREEIDAYLNYQLCHHDNPFKLAGMNEAVARIRRAIKDGERMAVYGDFDVDGVTATALLVETVASLGGEVQPYIPDRVDEGYGVHSDALKTLAERGVRLVVTVDCGIRAVEQIDFARRLGLDIIVTDHHTLGPRLPAAVACINPRREDSRYPFRDLAGVGVAYKLAQGLLRAESKVPGGRSERPLQEEDLLDLVALGTVADVVPLVDENRTLVYRGLQRLNQNSQDGVAVRPGLVALAEASRVSVGKITSTHIGFALGPRLNAAGRLKSAMISYELLTASEPALAQERARELDDLNKHRQELTARIAELAHMKVTEYGGPRALVFFAVDASLAQGEWPVSGVVGLVASQLREAYYRPAVVVERSVEVSQLCRGSCRSIPGFDITRALDECAARGLLMGHGGHAAAAGFSVETDRLPALQAALEEIATRELAGRELLPELNIDALVDLQDIDYATAEFIAQLEPFGCGNEAPLLASRDVEVMNAQPVGADNRHLKLRISDGRRGWDAIAFRQGYLAPELPRRVDIAYHVETNEWNGRVTLQLNVQDIRPA